MWNYRAAAPPPPNREYRVVSTAHEYLLEMLSRPSGPGIGSPQLDTRALDRLWEAALHLAGRCVDAQDSAAESLRQARLEQNTGGQR